jgi:hypothetical protein
MATAAIIRRCIISISVSELQAEIANDIYINTLAERLLM